MPTQQALLSRAQFTEEGTLHTEHHTDAPTGDESAGCGLPALRLVPVPDTGPPFDGDLPADASSWAGTVAGAWASAYEDPTEAAAADAGAGAGWPSVGTAGSGTGVTAGPGAGTAGTRAEDDWSRQFALLLTEALAGARPLRQILPWTTERARSHLDKLIPLFSGGQHPRVQRVVMSRPTRDAIEMTVVVGVGTRTRALAVRLERAWQPQQTARPAGVARSQLPGLTGQAARPGKTGRTAPRWLCTDIEAA